MTDPNADQREFWTDQAGHIWVDQADAMDAALAPVLETVLAKADLTKGQAVLDIGCGAGTSTVAAAAAVGTHGVACGLDISASLLTEARMRHAAVPNVSFVEADAQTHALAAGRFDCLISRFGVMFFEDPTAAFRNIAHALKPGGKMVFATWGAIPANPFFTFPAGVAKRVLGPVPKSDPDAPGPFAFRDVAVVTQILQDAGMAEITCDARQMVLTPEGDAQAVAALMCQIGPAYRAIEHYGADVDLQKKLGDALADALHVYQTPQGIQIPALINIFCATRS